VMHYEISSVLELSLLLLIWVAFCRMVAKIIISLGYSRASLPVDLYILGNAPTDKLVLILKRITIVDKNISHIPTFRYLTTNIEATIINDTGQK
jgi:hypothetical protein